MTGDRIAPPGKFRVIGLDQFDYDEWVSGDFNSLQEAKDYAQERTTAEKPYASSESIATIWSVYDDQGRFCFRGHW